MNNKYINDCIYAFEREYGKQFLLVEIEHVGSNLSTGQNVIDKKVTPVKGVTLPQTLARQFFYDVGYLRANSNFTYGGLDDHYDTWILVRRRKLPVNFNPDLNNEILFENKRYDKVKIEMLADGAAYIFKIKSVAGSLPYQQISRQGSDTLRFSELANEGT